MNVLVPILAAVFCLASSARAADPTVSFAGELVRSAGPDGLSAISHLDGDRYWTVDDEGGRLLQVRIPVDSATGAPLSWEIVSTNAIPGADDFEGVAADPLSPSVVWAADEKALRIFGFDAVSNRVVATVQLPKLSVAKNRGIESLAISPDGLSMWTCLECPLDDDGPFVRLFRFARGGAADPWRLAGSWAVPFDGKAEKIGKASFKTSAADLAVLSDGRLVMMELAKMKLKKVRTGKIVLSVVEVAGATDISSVPSLGGADFKPAAKRRIYDLDTARALCEGITEGPRLANGGHALLLVSDAEKGGDSKVLSLRLDPLPSEHAIKESR